MKESGEPPCEHNSFVVSMSCSSHYEADNNGVQYFTPHMKRNP